jgi:hypothetical protein
MRLKMDRQETIRASMLHDHIRTRGYSVLATNLLVRTIAAAAANESWVLHEHNALREGVDIDTRSG